jgi:hypothetical protein
MLENYHRPRARCVLTVPSFGDTATQALQLRGTDTIDVEIGVVSVTLTRNSAHKADECVITADWTDAGVDPRLVKHATVNLWFDDTPSGELQMTPETFQFVGIVKEIERLGSEDGLTVRITAHDQTTLFLACKLAHAGIPSFSMTLRDAWGRICDNTGYYDVSGQTIQSSVAVLRDRLRFVPPELEGQLGNLARVPERLARLGTPTFPHDCNSWDVWATMVSTLGLLTFIDKDECIVTSTEAFYAEHGAVSVLWGHNLREISEKVNTEAGKGVHLVSYDALGGRVVESFYPPPGDPRIRQKKAKGPRAGAARSSMLRPEEYQTFDYPWVQNQEHLDRCAKSAYDEYSRQQIEGHVTTSVMVLADDSGKEVRILDLRAGDPIRISIDPADMDQLATRIPSETQRISYLLDRGYSYSVAQIIAKNATALQDVLSNVFHVKAVACTLDVEKGFAAAIEFHNQISIDKAVSEGLQ